jgi:membrane-associated phospholipid phosphatase
MLDSSIGQSRVAHQGRELSAAVAAAFWRHRYLYGVSLASLALAVIVGLSTGNLPDFGVIEEFSFYLLVAFWIGGCGFAVFRIVWLAFVVRDPAPSRAFFLSFARFFGDRERIANSVNGLAVLFIFATAFSVLKGAIAVLVPFGWDLDLSRLDKALHFGHAPYEYLSGLLQHPAIVFGFNFAYNFWFVVMIAMFFTSAIARRDTLLRHQFILSFMLVWLLAGFFVAMGFSSAGPCYFARLGLGGEYTPLMDALDLANRSFPIWAISTQDMLWSGYTGASSGSIGISAFPSLHVATAVLFAIYASRRWGLVGAAFWAFAATIFVGSIVLGWHYAVDGYAGAALSILIWKSAGFWLDRHGTDGLPV